MVGAVRPSNFKDASDPSKKPDGPQNILDAVKVIATTQSMNKGTMVVMGGQIHSAYDVVKTRMVKPTENLSQVTPFSSPNFGILGTIKESRVIWVENHPLLNDIKTLKKFDVSHLMSLPLVPILYGSAGTPRFFIDAIKARPDVKAVVVVGTGEGSLDPQVLEFVQESQCLNRKNEVLPNCQPQPLQFVRSARAQTGYLRENYYFTRTVGSGTLTATKAQILTQLLFAFWPDHSEVKYESFREAFVPFLIEGKR